MTEVAMLVIGVLAGAGFIWLHERISGVVAREPAARAFLAELEARAGRGEKRIQALEEQLTEHMQVIGKLCDKARVPFRGDDP